MSPRMLETSIYSHFSSFSFSRFLPSLRWRIFSTPSLLSFPFSSFQHFPLFSAFFLSSSPSPLLSAFLRSHKKPSHACREHEKLQTTTAPSLYRSSSSKSYPCKGVLHEDLIRFAPRTHDLLLNYLLYRSPVCSTPSSFFSSLLSDKSSCILESFFLPCALTHPWNAMRPPRREDEEEISGEKNRESFSREGENKRSRGGGENKDEGDEKVSSSSSSVMWIRPRKKGMRIDRAKTKRQYKHRRHVGGWNYRWLGS